MIREIFDVLAAADAGDTGKSLKVKVKMNKSRIRSISSYSSNSIFYFPTIVSDQLLPDEVTMISRMVERVYASFVVACISLMPFHRVSADDKASIETYLQQFHQNIGIKTVPSTLPSSMGHFIGESASAETSEELKATQDFLYESWMKAKASGKDFIKIVAEEVSLNDMFNESALDPKTKIMRKRFLERQEELNTWGFLGEATAELFDEIDWDAEDFDEDEDDYDDEDEFDDDEDYDGYDIDTAIMDEAHMRFRKARVNRGNLKGKLKKDKKDTLENSKTMNDEGKGQDIDKASKEEADRLEEATLPAAERNKLKDSDFGLPKERKFPLHDAAHVKAAIKMFGKCPEKDRKELAGNINKAMDKHNVKVKISTKNPLSNYLPKEKLALKEEFVAQETEDFIIYTESADGTLNEGNVKSAIDSIKFSLESVSDNKILSCSSLSKLNQIESKLNKAKNKYVKYLNRYKKKWKENQKSGSKSKLQITFNKMKISNPKAFMKQYGEYIKIINRKLKLVEKRRAQLRKVKGIKNEAVDSITQIDFDSLDYVNKVIDEAMYASDVDTFTYIDEASKTLKDGSVVYYDDDADLGDDFYTRMYQDQRSTSRNRNELDKTRRENKSDIDDLKFQAREADRRSGIVQARALKAEEESRRLRDELAERDKNPAGIKNRGKRNAYEHRSFDKEVFTNMDMKKANDAVPTFAKATVGFIVEGDRSEEVVNRDVLIGIKAFVHRVHSTELINDLYNCIINKRKFLKFVKFVSGEEKSLADLMFGIKELRLEALDNRSAAGRWRSAFKSRRRWSKISVPYLMKEYTPNGTLVMTKAEVDFIKSEYGVDVMDPNHVKMVMDSQFLLGFVVVDQAEEMVHVIYDGHGYGFQTYTFASLEREANRTNREMMSLFRAMSR